MHGNRPEGWTRQDFREDFEGSNKTQKKRGNEM